MWRWGGRGSGRGRPQRLGPAFVATTLALGACSGDYPHLHVGDRQVDAQIEALAAALNAEPRYERRFVLVRELSKAYRSVEAHRRQILFLTSYVQADSNDPFNAFYLTTVAQLYRELGSEPLARHYFERILRNYPDALVEGDSIHLTALGQLIELERNAARRVDYYKELIARFSDAIDLPRSHFFLSQAYEELGEWEQAIQSYGAFLAYPGTDIPGFANAYRQVLKKVDFYYSDKSWVVSDLDSLVAAIKRAIARRDPRELRRLQAKSNFFTMSWEQQTSDESVALAFDLGAFPLSRVRFDRQLDDDSNTQEAFLRTTGWSYRIETWYLYFRKVEFKPDPEVDGRWEWAGIFFGEKL